MELNFLLTYSVKAPSEKAEDIQKASKVRVEIADIEFWSKHNDVETTFMGSMVVDGYADSTKKNNAINKVTEKLLPILKKHSLKSGDVKIYCVMMLQNLEQPFDFTIVR
ncbi:hypothetical protein WKH71_05245 [Pantoea agglomerans]|uniref:hypothetical protein n=1 Tax=Enterobacter agglomerans TaxID=549 RepID=UPI003C7C1BA8